MTDLDKLIASVEAGKPSIVFAISQALERPESSYEVTWARAAYEGSLDAAQRLHDALLPGWAWDIHCANVAEVWERGQLAKSTRVFNDGGNPARAWLLAILRALKAKEATP